jgi:hypothetical protein
MAGVVVGLFLFVVVVCVCESECELLCVCVKSRGVRGVDLLVVVRCVDVVETIRVRVSSVCGQWVVCA